MEKLNSDKSKQTVAKFGDQILILQSIFEIWLKSAKVRNLNLKSLKLLKEDVNQKSASVD